ncbi:MAG: hypothetical protein AUH92_02750 [Acidobacteria bacterium 13_1_40CM_4_69_4]|nr:MAG: hypothetical protein AUH92_02750 [Acidobacteria bacterium 13_1_40CM_4_69_4]
MSSMALPLRIRWMKTPGDGSRAFDILLVEDSRAETRLALEAHKEPRLDLRAHAVRDGAKALSFLRREHEYANAPRPDLILLDLNHPGLDGRELLTEIKGHSDLRRIPLAVLTTSRSREDVLQCHDLGANCYIAKPSGWEEFTRVISKTVSFWLGHSALPGDKSRSARGDPIRVLIIDDNPADVRLVKEMLREQGPDEFVVSEAGTLRDGLQRMERETFEAVLLDLSLPDGSGAVTLGHVFPGASRVPILVLTGSADETMGASALRQGAEDFLVKGDFTGAALARAIRHAMERSRWRKYLDHLAHHDSLTKLPNRTLFHDRLSQALEGARRNQEAVAVLFMDLDRFKEINDTLGHAVGDAVLECAAERLKLAVRGSDTVARVGGDEFALLLPEVGSFDDVVLVGDKILSALRAPFLIGPHRVGTSASIGASVYPNDGEDAEALLNHADAAMYRAKQQGRNSLEFHSRPTGGRLTGRGALAQGLREAIDRQQFVLHYLPMIDAHGQVVSLEALIRWRHPDWGLIYPLQFIPMAEETGLILDIGDWVVRSACRDRRRWQEGAALPPRVSVNLSLRQLYQGRTLVESLSRALAENGLDPRCLEVEVAEKALAHDETVAVQTLRDLADLDVSIALDDYGTGYSSLSRLKRLPIRRVKIDRSFIHNVPVNQDDAALVTAMIGMGHGLKLSVVAEGVETGEQMSFLVRQQIDHLQGHYVGRAVPAESCAALLAAPRRKEA